ncbi:hypothetical protein MicloDRAFT_00027370 [Microvirga lotononidis]|uniref:Lipoprotein n=1 Tax=Microvirga lotononidis TaxID=864069 RepID=I4YXA7_9HYPH|nr:hypothetical protein MicloDRAFT_00027370 [Microvirga lotononidis]
MRFLSLASLLCATTLLGACTSTQPSGLTVPVLAELEGHPPGTHFDQGLSSWHTVQTRPKTTVILEPSPTVAGPVTVYDTATSVPSRPVVTGPTSPECPSYMSRLVCEDWLTHKREKQS